MQLFIRLIPDQGKESGTIEIAKSVGTSSRMIGEIKYDSERQRKWLVMMLTEGHPNVSLVG